MIKNILFDLDGTMIDSKKCIFTVYTQLFEEMGIAVPPEKELETFIGPPVEDKIRKYLKNDGDVKKYSDRFREIYKQIDLFATNTPYDGIVDVLQTLQNKYKLYVATTKNEFFAKKIMHGFDLDKYFVQVYGSLSNIGRVNKTDVINTILKENGLEKAQTMIIGDTIFDVEGAENTEIKVGLVSYGYGVEKDFINKKIEFFANSPLEILEKLEIFSKE